MKNISLYSVGAFYMSMAHKTRFIFYFFRIILFDILDIHYSLQEIK